MNNRKTTIENPCLDEPGQPIYVLYRFLQQLPPDITNVGLLTHEQSEMAATVSAYADLTHEIAMNGLSAIGKLMVGAGEGCVDCRPLGRLIQHLSAEAQCMLEASADYNAAATEFAVQREKGQSRE